MLFHPDSQCFLLIPCQLHEIIEILSSNVLGIRLGYQGLVDADEVMHGRP